MADYQFMAIFKCPALPDVEFECTVGPLKIEITVAGRTFLVPQTVGHVAGSRSPVVPVAQSATLKLPVGQPHLIITARADSVDATRSRAEPDEEIDQTIAQLAAIYTPQLFYDPPVYRGAVLSGGAFSVRWAMSVAAPLDPRTSIERELGRCRASVRSDQLHHNRFALMSRIYSRAVAMAPGDESFLWFWTILEIFPMEGLKGGVKALRQHLSRVTGLPLAEIDERLAVGPLYGMRSKLVHHGVFEDEVPTVSEKVQRLGRVVVTVLREMNGLPYDPERLFPSVRPSKVPGDHGRPCPCGSGKAFVDCHGAGGDGSV